MCIAVHNTHYQPFLYYVITTSRQSQHTLLSLGGEQTLEELESDSEVVAIVGAGHVPGMQQFWAARQQRMLEEGGIPQEESEALHFNLQLFPGADLPDGGKYTKKMLRYGTVVWNDGCICSGG